MAKVSRQQKVELFNEWHTSGKPDIEQFAKERKVKPPLMERIVREGLAKQVAPESF